MDDMWPRLGRLWLRALLPGVGLALLLFGLLVAMPVWLAFPVIAQGPVFGAALVVAAVVLTLFAHSLFVTLLTDHLVTGQWRPRWRALGAALLMTIPFALFSWLDMAGSSYGCADGQVIDRNMIPMWPWAWIGWLALTMSALPARLLSYTAADLEPWYHRAMLLAPFAVIVLVTGLPFQRRAIDCTPPFDGGWGIFEGGMVAIPLLALFLFSMAFSLAVLSAAFVIPKSESPST